ncbi:hypothetical protein jhhlp_007909 [Lomentospora prolificans]|uniref:Uncharacterized protein n=1 Tax=Lomentospora prolificans TaxID=41688 RepID=A0A2N3N0Y0_9PEZI|nr:hypothetical protein jhhlp_007909 [Lomentospora prolificans]
MPRLAPQLTSCIADINGKPSPVSNISAAKAFDDRVRKDTYYSQAVHIGERIEISSQGQYRQDETTTTCGHQWWDRLTELIPEDLGKEIDQAFDNVEHTLRKAGGMGWEQLYERII